ncbi:pro-head protease [Escherichia coli]|nr:pro-head protease [Escherichia coli]
MSGFTSGDGCSLMMIPSQNAPCTHEGRFVNRPFYWYVLKDWEYDRSKEAFLLKEIDLWEVSLVTFPSNDEARISDVKNALARGEIPEQKKSKESCVMSDSPVPRPKHSWPGAMAHCPARR